MSRVLPIVFSGLVWLAGVVVVGEAGEDWPSFLGARRDGKSLESGILLDWPKTGPPLVWTRTVGEGYSMPSVAGGRLYHFDREGDEVRLTSLGSVDGELVWQVRAPTEYEDYYGYSGGPRASPVVDGDRIYTFGVDGWLRCHRASDGAIVWQLNTHSRFGVVQNFFGAASTPLVEGDLLLVQVGGSPSGSARIHSGQVRGDSSAIVAFDKKTGEIRYRFKDELASYASPVVRSIDGERWAFAFLRGGLLAFEPENGRERFFYPWRAPRLESVNASTPVVVGREVLITESYGLGASMLRVGEAVPEVVWQDLPRQRPRLACHWSTPIHHEGFIYASSGEKSGSADLVAIDWGTGEVRWRQPGLRRSSLLYVDGHLVVLTEYGDLLLVEARPDRFHAVASVRLWDERQRPPLRYPAWSAPILSHGILYLRSEGRLTALRLIPES